VSKVFWNRVPPGLPSILDSETKKAPPKGIITGRGVRGVVLGQLSPCALHQDYRAEHACVSK
jgi:hypothetical protein